jgi:hypothetical protein
MGGKFMDSKTAFQIAAIAAMCFFAHCFVLSAVICCILYSRSPKRRYLFTALSQLFFGWCQCYFMGSIVWAKFGPLLCHQLFEQFRIRLEWFSALLSILSRE